MPTLTSKLKPVSGFSHYLHLGINSVLPFVIFVLVRTNFSYLALLLILLSKWRMFVMRPRFWLANIRANAIDILFGVSTVVFMNATTMASWQLIWAGIYFVWLIWIKPGSSQLMTSTQALFGQTVALTALFLGWGDAALFWLVLAAWAITNLSARHFFGGFEESHAPMYANIWAFFGGALTWVLGHWLLFYGYIAQPTLILTLIGFGLASMYYMNERDTLSRLIRRQLVFVMVAIVTVIIVFSDWGDKMI